MIAIIDYGVGNLGSVEKAFQYIGYKAEVTSDKNTVLGADAIVLPGVGAYADAMRNLEKVGMIDVVKRAVAEDRPFLGICLGLQLLFDHSEEGDVKGLGLFKGKVKQFPLDMNLKVPHMGWNSLKTDKDCRLFYGLDETPYVYFVHSYYLDAEDNDIVAARTEYGIEFRSAVNRGNVFATQFHPEKSGDVGLKLLRNWAELVYIHDKRAK